MLAHGDPVLDAFELDFFDDGRRRHVVLGAGWGVRFEDVPQYAGSAGTRAIAVFRAGITW